MVNLIKLRRQRVKTRKRQYRTRKHSRKRKGGGIDYSFSIIDVLIN